MDHLPPGDCLAVLPAATEKGQKVARSMRLSRGLENWNAPRRWHRVPVDPGANRDSSTKAVQDQKPIGENSRSTQRWKDVPRGTAPGTDSEERREPVSDIGNAVADGLRVLDLKRPIREADLTEARAVTSPTSRPFDNCAP